MSHTHTGRVDFHLHSYASNVTDYYAANSFSIPESYSKPLELYRDLKARGMTLVTLTDHNSIDGVLELLAAGMRDVFISAEMTTTFPEDGCNIHVTVANMTEAQFAEVNRLRPNVYEMIAYVDDQIATEHLRLGCNRLAYFMTHPLMSTQNRPYGREGSLSLEHIEKALLLCNALEVRNGSRTRSLNEFTERLLANLDRSRLERLADKHGLSPKGDEPWRKAVLSGSDDHSGINPGRTWTEFPLPTGRALTPNDLVDAIRARRTAPAGAHGGPVTLAHAMLKLLHDGQRPENRGSNSRPVAIGGPVQTLLKLVFDPSQVKWREHAALKLHAALGSEPVRKLRRQSTASRPFERVLASEVSALLASAQFRRELAALDRTDDKIFLVVNTILNRLFTGYVQRIARSDRRNLLCTIKELVALVTSNVLVSLPYLLSYLHQSSDRKIVRDVRQAFDLPQAPKLVLVTDTLFEINGVSRTIWKMLDEAERRGVDFVVLACLSVAEREQYAAQPRVRRMLESGRLVLFTSIVNMDLPHYDGLQVRVPAFLELLKHLQEAGYTKMQISTPGVMGLAGLAAAKILQIETSSTYHTCFPEYVENYTQDISLEALTWKYMIVFYHSVDEVVVPSKFIAKLLHDRGLRNRSLLVLDRWVDLERFHPAKRDERYWTRHGLARAGELVKFVYVGRVSVEKNLNVLADAYLELRERHPNAHLVIIGDGPYRAGLQARLAGAPATFTGMLEGEELSIALASCDAKLFPSTTDTWGNAPLEAQASGLPVVVSDMGGPQELMRDGLTGYKVAGRNVRGLVSAMERLMDREVRERLGANARQFVEIHAVPQPFTAILDSSEYRRRAKVLKDLLAREDSETRAEVALFSLADAQSERAEATLR